MGRFAGQDFSMMDGSVGRPRQQDGLKRMAGLLGLLLRVLTPEAALLHLHFHQHTPDDQPRSTAPAKRSPQAAVSTQHQHCHAEQLYDAPFQPAGPVVVPTLPPLLRYATYRPAAPVCRAPHLLDGACLRGPPAGRA